MKNKKQREITRGERQREKNRERTKKDENQRKITKKKEGGSALWRPESIVDKQFIFHIAASYKLHFCNLSCTKSWKRSKNKK
jgi:hypothetical protein